MKIEIARTHVGDARHDRNLGSCIFGSEPLVFTLTPNCENRVDQSPCEGSGKL